MATGYDPLFWQNLQALQAAAAAKFGSGAIGISSGFRTPEEQAQIIANNWYDYDLNPADRENWLSDVRSMGPIAAGDKWANILGGATKMRGQGKGQNFRSRIGLPGKSYHQHGLAADLAYASPDVRSWAHQTAPEHGLKFSLPNEDWHVELAGARSGQRSPQMRVSTKDAQMTPMDQKKPETLWERLTNTGERSGLNAFEAFAAALDPLILPEMRAGGVIREQGAQRAAFAKEGKTKNATINELRKRAATGDTIAQRYLDAISSGALDPKTGFSGYLNEVGQMAQLNKRLASEAGRNAQGVQSSFKLPDNSGTVAVMRDGTTVVRKIGGEILTGAEAENFVQEATDRYNQSQKDLYQGRAEGTGEGKLPTAQQIVQAQKEGGAKVEFIQEVNKNRANIESTINNYQLALNALDQGAKTGRVFGMLPNITATAQMIETAKQRLGLDVIGSVTFGALSEGELNLAMDTGLPSDKLSETELRKWIEERMAAQKKALAALNETALYFSDPSTTFNSYYSDFLGIQPKGSTAPQKSDANPLGL